MSGAAAAHHAPFVARLRENLARDPYAAYVTLATVERGRDGAIVPRARTVVFEGFSRDDEDRFGLAVKLSADSNKYVKRASDEVELCWWFSSSHVQFRIRGPMRFDVSEDGAARNAVWRELAPGDRAQFFYPADTLAASRGDDAYKRQREAFDRSRGEIPPNFCVGVLVPTEVDVLDLNDSSRTLWRRASVDDAVWEEHFGFAPPVLSADALVDARS